MRKPSRTRLLISLLVATGCSSEPSTGGQMGTASGNGGAASGSTSGGTSPSAGSASGVVAATSGVVPAASGNTTPTSGSTSSGAGSGASMTSGASSGATSGSVSSSGSTPDGGTNVGAGPFTCNMVLGLFTTGQWFSGMGGAGWGATTPLIKYPGIDTTKWEGKTQKYSYIETWVPAGSANWNIAVSNPCAQNAMAPDRVVFVAHHQPWNTTQAQWQTLLDSVIATIKTKYPSAKEIDILTMGRAPMNMLCANNNDQYTIISPAEDMAFQAVADASAGMVKVGPKYFVPSCAGSYIIANDTDYTTAASNSLAMQLATYYIAHP
jgi:hypothetical protein